MANKNIIDRTVDADEKSIKRTYLVGLKGDPGPIVTIEQTHEISTAGKIVWTGPRLYFVTPGNLSCNEAILFTECLVKAVVRLKRWQAEVGEPVKYAPNVVVPTGGSV